MNSGEAGGVILKLKLLTSGPFVPKASAELVNDGHGTAFCTRSSCRGELARASKIWNPRSLGNEEMV